MAVETTYTEETGIQVSTISGHTSPLALYVVTVIFTIVACFAIVARLARSSQSNPALTMP
jgi:lipoprotein signal peptidase